MTVAESLARYGLIPSDEALPDIRALLALEAEAERTGSGREEDLALLCCVQLFARGQLEDVLRIWDAKMSGFDLGCYLDVQFLCGAGLETTKLFLASSLEVEAAEALTYLVECAASLDFVDFDPQAYLKQYRDYFAVE